MTGRYKIHHLASRLANKLSNASIVIYMHKVFICSNEQNISNDFMWINSQNKQIHIWETKLSVHWFDYDESLTWQGLNSNPEYFSYFTFILISFEESRLLVSWCAGGRCGMMSSDEDHGRSRRPDAEDHGWSHRSGTRWSDDREVGWRRVRSAPCTWRQGARVSWLSLKTKVNGLSVGWPQNS
jgi:hypothetical protein